MTQENTAEEKTNVVNEKQVENKTEATTDNQSAVPEKKPRRRPGGGRQFQKREHRPKDDGKMSVLGIRRITKVTKAAKRMSFSACVVYGDMQGKVGIGLGKGREVNSAIMQATSRARKLMISVNLKNGTIPYQVEGKFCKSTVLLRNAPKGTGIKAGNVVRAICTCLGVENIVTKAIANRNFLNVAHATITALGKLNSAKNAG